MTAGLDQYLLVTMDYILQALLMISKYEERFVGTPLILPI